MALIQAEILSNCLKRTVTIQAIIPLDCFTLFEEPKPLKPFKTLYLLHGIFGNHTDWLSGTRIQRWANEHQIAVIMPSGDNYFYVDNEITKQYYGRFIGEELVEITRQLFPLSHKREDTYIGGLSMGGYGAFRNGLKYCDTFGAIAGLSTAFIERFMINSQEDENPIYDKAYYKHVFGELNDYYGSDNDLKALIKKQVKQKQNVPKIYMAIGKDDFLYQDNIEYIKLLDELNVAYTFEEGEGAHEWDFWDRYIKRVLEWLGE